MFLVVRICCLFLEFCWAWDGFWWFFGVAFDESFRKFEGFWIGLVLVFNCFVDVSFIHEKILTFR